MLQSIVRRTCVALLATAGAAPWAVVAAQSIIVNLGSAPIVAGAPGTKLTVPIIIDLSAAGGAASIASLQAGVTWNPARLTFDSLRRAPGATGWTVTSNTASAASGSITFSAVRGTNLPATATVANAFYTVAGGSGGTHVVLSPTGAANAAAQNMLAAVRPRALDVCIAIPGRWGDVTNDGLVDISDAQQIARHAALLPVVDLTATLLRGDVNGDGNVDVTDAEEIARFSVGLPAAARINTDVSVIQAATSVVVAPAGPLSLTVGEARQLLATSAAGATDLTGCAPTGWSSSNPGVAVVNAGGFVNAIGAGTAAITASVGGGVSSIVALDVKVLLIPSRLAISVQPSSNAGSGVAFARQPAIQLLNSSGAPVPLPGVAITAAIASGGGTLNGSTTALTDVNGLATFSNLGITGVTGIRTITFSSLGLTQVTSAAVSITAGPASQLTITTQPSATAVSGLPLVQQPAVQLRDQAGNAAAQAGIVVTAAIATGNGTLGGTATSTTNTSGRATFANLAINGTGTFTLRYTSPGLANATSASVTVSAPATQVTITTQPSPTAQGGTAFVQQPAIQLRNAANGIVSQSGIIVTAAIASGPGTLGGTLTATTNSSGLATFTNLFISGPGGDNTIRFTSPPLTAATSAVVTASTGTPPAIVDAEPVFDAAAIMVHQDIMDLYTSLSAMTATIGSSIAGFHPGEDPRNELALTTGRGGIGKALRINFLGGEQTGSTWVTHGGPSNAGSATHYIQYYARVNFSAALTTTVGVKWLMAFHNSGNDRIQWHMHWPQGICPSRASMHRQTYWQVMDQSRFTTCQGAQPIGPYIENVNDNQWHRYTHEYRPNSKAGGRDGVVRMWIDGVKVADVSLAACGVTPPGGEKAWCLVDDIDNLATNDGILFLKFGGPQTTSTPPWTMDIDDLRWWKR